MLGIGSRRADSVRPEHLHVADFLSKPVNWCPITTVGTARNIVDILLHSMLFSREDILHAGFGYITANNRSFLSMSSKDALLHK